MALAPFISQCPVVNVQGCFNAVNLYSYACIISYITLIRKKKALKNSRVSMVDAGAAIFPSRRKTFRAGS